MPEFGYSFANYDPILHVRASGREVDVSPKAASEVCRVIKGMTIAEAKKFLEDVIKKKKAVPFKRYKKKVAHRSQLQGFFAGRFPVKAAKKILEVLDNLEANAEFKGMDIERIKIIHAAAYGGRKTRNFMPRAFGRASPDYNTLVHIELVGSEA
jgi:large subunit ribosomal protein L22